MVAPGIRLCPEPLSQETVRCFQKSLNLCESGNKGKGSQNQDGILVGKVDCPLNGILGGTYSLLWIWWCRDSGPSILLCHTQLVDRPEVSASVELKASSPPGHPWGQPFLSHPIGWTWVIGQLANPSGKEIALGQSDFSSGLELGGGGVFPGILCVGVRKRG